MTNVPRMDSLVNEYTSNIWKRAVLKRICIGRGLIYISTSALETMNLELESRERHIYTEPDVQCDLIL